MKRLYNWFVSVDAEANGTDSMRHVVDYENRLAKALKLKYFICKMIVLNLAYSEDNGELVG